MPGGMAGHRTTPAKNHTYLFTPAKCVKYLRLSLPTLASPHRVSQIACDASQPLHRNAVSHRRHEVSRPYRIRAPNRHRASRDAGAMPGRIAAHCRKKTARCATGAHPASRDADEMPHRAMPASRDARCRIARCGATKASPVQARALPTRSASAFRATLSRSVMPLANGRSRAPSRQHA